MMSKEKLIELDSKIDEGIKNIPILSLPRDFALYHLLVYFEDYMRMPKIHQNLDRGDHQNHAKHGQDALHFAVLWIYKNCPNTQVNHLMIKENENYYMEAHKLFEMAINYSMIWDFMTALHKSRYYIVDYQNNVVKFKAIEALERDHDLADSFMRFSSDGVDKVNRYDFDMGSVRDKIIELDLIDLGNGKIKYNLTDDLYYDVEKIIGEIYKNRWELDSSWCLGDYSVSDFRKFWVSLITLCVIHQLKCFFSGVEGMAINSVIRIWQKKRWINELTKRSGLDKKIVDSILSDLIFDISLYGLKDKKDPDITYQPFFPINKNLLLLSPNLSILSNPERNLWDLVNIKRPEIHSVLRNKKESIWIEELKEKLKGYSLDSFGPINFVHKEVHSDIDLLVLDKKDRFGIAFQMKWIIEPDRIKDICYFDEEIITGQKQAERVDEWMGGQSNELKILSKKLDVNLKDFKIVSMVLSKNLLGSGVVHESDIAVANEWLIDWILGSKHKKSLRTFWKAVKEHRYLAKEGEHYRKSNIEAEFNGVKFIGENLGAEIIKYWEPKHIDFKGL